MFTMSTSSVNYHHGDLREALLREGVALLQESGTEALTLRKLAQRLGVSHMAPYRHFSDKDALLAAIAATGFRQLKSRLERAGSAAAPNGSALLRKGTAYVKFALDEPAMFRLMFGATRPAGQYDELDAARAEAFDVLIGEIPADLQPEARTMKARGCWALVHGLALLLLDGMLQVPQGVEPEDWIAALIGNTVAPGPA